MKVKVDGGQIVISPENVSEEYDINSVFEYARHGWKVFPVIIETLDGYRISWEEL